MDTLSTSDLELIYPLETGAVTRIFSSKLLQEYPNCSLSIASKDVPCKSVTITDITVEEYDQILLVLTGGTSSLECSERSADLLDKHGFISRLDRMLAGSVANYQQDLIKRLTPFHHKQVNIFMCQNLQEYQHCKLALNDPSVVSIQVLTIGHHIVFGSYGQGIPILTDLSVYESVAESRRNNIPRALSKPSKIISDVIELATAAKEDNYETVFATPKPTKISKQELLEQVRAILPDPRLEIAVMRETLDTLLGLEPEGGFEYQQALDIITQHMPVNARPFARVIGLNAKEDKRNLEDYCGACGNKSECDCTDFIDREWQDLGSLDEVIYLDTLFILYRRALVNNFGIGLRKTDTSKLDTLVRMSPKVEACILKALYTFNWNSVGFISTCITESKCEVAMLRSHLGFVRI